MYAFVCSQSAVDAIRFRSSGKSAKFHVWSREIPAGACRRLSERLVISGPEFAIVQLAGSLGKFDSLLDGFMVELRELAEIVVHRELDIHGGAGARGRVRGGAAAEVGTNSPPGRARLACLRVRGDVSPRRGNARSVRERPCEEERRARAFRCRHWSRCHAPCCLRSCSRRHRFWRGPRSCPSLPCASSPRAPAGARPLGAPKG